MSTSTSPTTIAAATATAAAAATTATAGTTTNDKTGTTVGTGTIGQGPAVPGKQEQDNEARAMTSKDHDVSVATTTAGATSGRMDSSTSTNNNDEKSEVAAVTLSKNQQKKRRRLERMLAVKKRRKQQEKEAKAERAAAQGRDVQAEREIQAKNEAKGEGKRRRQERWAHRLQLAADNFGVCLDCAFESDMTDKEITSLALQLRYCYATNRRSDVPTLLTATSVTAQTRQHLERVAGFDEWQTRAFTCTAQPLEDYYGEDRRANLVYLTSDSENVLQDLDKNKIYIIGGIVDRNRLKRAAFTRAQQLHIPTAKLPLEEHLKKMESTRVLTCNHVFDILMHYGQYKNWEQALLSVLPQRKGAQLANDRATDHQDNQLDTNESKDTEKADEERVAEDTSEGKEVP